MELKVTLQRLNDLYSTVEDEQFKLLIAILRDHLEGEKRDMGFKTKGY